MQTSTEVHLIARPDGIPDESCFRFVSAEVPDAGDGEVLVRNVYMSVDPAMRPPLTNGQQKLDTVMGGQAEGSSSIVMRASDDRADEGTVPFRPPRKKGYVRTRPRNGWQQNQLGT